MTKLPGRIRPLQPRRDRLPNIDLGERKAVTVCIAALFNWNYSPPGEPPKDIGKAALVASDRMITTGNVQYEPNQSKFSRIADNAIILISGDYSIHSEALKDTHAQLKGDQTRAPKDIAIIYGRAIQAIKRRQAEDIYLAPLGLNTDSFLGQQKEFSIELTNAIIQNLQSFEGEEVDAIVIGSSILSGGPNAVTQIHLVDTKGRVSCEDDVGFAAIGIGAWHARSRLMQAGYTSNFSFAQSLAAIYGAKKSSEISPGVGVYTDFQLVLRDAIIPLWPHVADKLRDLYLDFEDKRRVLVTDAVNQLQDFINLPHTQPEALDVEKGQIARNKDSNGSSAAPAPKAAQGNEVGKG